MSSTVARRRRSLREYQLILTRDDPEFPSASHESRTTSMSPVDGSEVCTPLGAQVLQEQSIKSQQQDVTTKSDCQQMNQHRHIGRSRHPFFLWWHELAAIFVSSCALLTILLVVYPYRDSKPIPNWPSGIGINTIISILSVIIRAGLVVATAEALGQQKWIWFRRPHALSDFPAFDQGSRGPGGALKLLINLSGWSWMGAFGALIIISAVAIGPFAQQLVRYDSCFLPTSLSNATIPRQGLYLLHGLENGDRYYDPPAAMQKSIYASIFAPQANVLSVNCSSGTCSYLDPYTSLGYYSYCEDLSDKLDIVEIYDTADASNSTVTAVTYTLPSGEHISNNYSDIDLSHRPFFVSKSEPLDVYGIPHEVIWTESHTQPSIRKNCTASERQDPVTSWYCQGYGAAQCYIMPCVYNYTAEVTGGLLNETVTDTQTEWGTSGIGDLTMVHLPCLTKEQRGQLEADGYVFDDTAEWLPYNSSIRKDGWWWSSNHPNNRKNPYQTDIVPPGCHYQISDGAASGIDQWLSIILEGEITWWYESYVGPATVQVMYNATHPSFTHIEDLFKNISIGITTGLRHSATSWFDGSPPPADNVTDVIFAPNEPAQGIIFETQTCVEVRWVWLVFPAVLIILTAIFVLATIIDSTLHAQRTASMTQSEESSSRSAYHSATAWKSSLLPLMYHGLEDHDLRSHAPDEPVPLSEMEAAAKATKIRFAHDKDGWKIVKVD